MSSPFGVPQRLRGRGGCNKRGRVDYNNIEQSSRSNDWKIQKYQNCNNNGRLVPHDRESFAPRGPPQKEGDITDPAGLPRRVFVRNIPRHTTLKDLKDFFGKDQVEALYVDGKFAHVQFKEPSQRTKAVTRSGEKLLGKSIVIEIFDDTKARGKPVETYSSSDLMREIEESRRIRTSMLVRSRSSSSISSIEDNPNEFRWSKPPDVPPPPTIESKQLSESSSILPSNIDLTLRLVITDKTARKLSVPQLDDLVKYFSEEREFVINNKQKEQHSVVVFNLPEACPIEKKGDLAINEEDYQFLFDPM